jgi:hypothetical protein
VLRFHAWSGESLARCLLSSHERPRALVTAPFRGKGMVLLESITDVVCEPWIDHVLLKILGRKGEAFLQNPNTVLTPHIGGTAYDMWRIVFR